MKSNLSQKKRESSLATQRRSSKITNAVIVVLLIFVFGLILNALDVFGTLRNADSLYWEDLILFLLISITIEIFWELFGPKEDVTNTVFKKIFNSLCLSGVALAAFWFVFGFLRGG